MAFVRAHAILRACRGNDIQDADVYHGYAVKVAKWGNSLAVRLPKEVVERLGLKENDEVRLVANGERGTLAVERDSDQARRTAALERLRKLRGRMPADYKFDREEANERPGLSRFK